MSEATPIIGHWPLFPQHEAYLSARGVPIAAAKLARIRSLTESDANRVLSRTVGSAGLYLPHCHPNGEVLNDRVRLDTPGRGPKFQLRAGAPVSPWLPPSELLAELGFSAGALSDSRVPLLVVEGPVKALALLAHGMLAVGLGGVSAGGHDKDAKDRKRTLRAHPLLREWAALDGRCVTIVFDAGLANNPMVADGAALNALGFAAEGAEVRVARLPLRENGGDQGPDDLLSRCGPDSLRALVRAAVPAMPIDRLKAAVRALSDAPSTNREERQATIRAEVVPMLQELVVRAVLRRVEPTQCDEFAVEVSRSSGLPKRVVKQAVESFVARLKPSTNDTQRRVPRSVDARPEIVLGPDDHEVTQAALDALTNSIDIFQRGNALCEIVLEEHTVIGRVQPRRVPIIRQLSQPRICEHLTKQARFVHPEHSKHVRPPDYIPRQIEARGQYPGFRRLDRIVDHPVLLADGRILDCTGYDEQSATYVYLDDVFPRIPREPLHAEAISCARELLNVVQDFPFVGPEDQAAWLTAVLSASARGAFEGSTPLFAITGNAPGSGKSLLCELIGIIVTGRPIPVMSPATHRAKGGSDECVDDQEMQKRIVAHMLAATPMVVIDNARTLGSPAFYAALTSHGLSGDRILGANNLTNKAMTTMWFATGNNLLLPREMQRRSVRIRLLSTVDNPFKREDFAEPNLAAAVQRRHTELLVAALTILRAYIVAGRPSVGIAPLGSFVEWSMLVRNAVVWLGLPDPLMTMAGGEEECFDRETATLRSLLIGLEPITRRGRATSKQILRSLENEHEPNPALAHAVGELVQSRNPTPTQLSHALEPLRNRVVDGLKLVGKSGNEGWAWSVVRVAPPHKRDARDESDGGSSSSESR